MLKGCLKAVLICLAILIALVAGLYWYFYSPWGPAFGPGNRFVVPDGYHGWLLVERNVKGAPALPVVRNFDDPNVRYDPHGYYEYVFTPTGHGYIAVPNDHSGGWHTDDEAFYYGDGHRTPIPMEVTELSADDQNHNEYLKDNNTVAVWGGFCGIYSVPGFPQFNCDSYFVGTYKEFVKAKAAADGADHVARLLQSVRH